jgi:hypothetical protein
MCKGYDTTLAALGKIRQGFDSAAVICKQKIEQQLTTAELRTIAVEIEKELPVALVATVANVDDEVNESSSSEGTIPYNPDDTLPYGMETDDEEDIEVDPAESSGETSPPSDDEP